jgi:hypothetical protein
MTVTSSYRPEHASGLSAPPAASMCARSGVRRRADSGHINPPAGLASFSACARGQAIFKRSSRSADLAAMARHVSWFALSLVALMGPACAVASEPPRGSPVPVVRAYVHALDQRDARGVCATFAPRLRAELVNSEASNCLSALRGAFQLNRHGSGSRLRQAGILRVKGVSSNTMTGVSAADLRNGVAWTPWRTVVLRAGRCNDRAVAGRHRTAFILLCRTAGLRRGSARARSHG